MRIVERVKAGKYFALLSICKNCSHDKNKKGFPWEALSTLEFNILNYCYYSTTRITGTCKLAENILRFMLHI